MIPTASCNNSIALHRLSNLDSQILLPERLKLRLDTQVAMKAVEAKKNAEPKEKLAVSVSIDFKIYDITIAYRKLPVLLIFSRSPVEICLLLDVNRV